MEPNYQHYTLTELLDALENIDKEAYPERVLEIRQQIETLNACNNKDNSGTSARPLNPVHAQKYADEPRTSNWLVAYWRGHFSLPISYWVVGIGVSVMTYWFDGFIETKINGAGTRVELGSYIFLLYGVLIPVVLWQGVGVYRSANRHPFRGGSLGWAGAAKTITILGAIGFTFNLFSTGVPALKEAVSLVTEKRSYPPLTLRLLNHGSELELSGGIEVGNETLLQQTLEANPNITTLHLHSIGGRILGAVRLAELVEQFNLDTYVKESCASACTLVYLAGRQRFIGEDGQLSFHAASLGGSSTHDDHPLSGTLREQYENANVPEWFLKKVFKTPNHELWTPTHQELIKAGIVDEVVDSNAFGFSGYGPAENITVADIEEGLLSHAYMRAIKQYDNATYQTFVQFNLDGMRAGNTINSIAGEINTLLKSRINHYLAHASDETAVAYWKVLIAQMEALGKETPLTCASFAFPSVVPLEYHYGNQGYLPQQLIDAEFSALAALVNSFEAAPVLLPKEHKNALVRDIVDAVKAEDPLYYEVIRTPDTFLATPTIMCQAAISLNKLFIASSIDERGALLRTINTE
ncbi:hypothetical protein GTH32_06815 [Alteromonas sp. 345S023]|uniref:Uncharacterized protein n=1 Tax=Alteromonas profundi TaxID=2696062 RepID=A0A7X5LLI6_9ALTE|nr:hypothetical protein [Alteromonas profundi]NDV90910.1 hypothetical protein [Alteromonas profundi]